GRRSCGELTGRLRRLFRTLLGQAGEQDHQGCRASEAFPDILPVADEDHLLIRANAGERAFLADVAHEAGRVGEAAVAEGDDGSLRPDVDLLDIGAAAERLDGDEFEKM